MAQRLLNRTERWCSGTGIVSAKVPGQRQRLFVLRSLSGAICLEMGGTSSLLPGFNYPRKQGGGFGVKGAAEQ